MQKLIIIAIVLFTSCSTMRNGIKKNDTLTDKTIESLFSDNGNVFYIRSSYSTFSTVWAYKSDKIEVYNLANGKIAEKSSHDATNYINKVPKERVFEVDNCMELDGDIIGYKVSFDGNKYQEDFPVSMKCFLDQKYKAQFLNTLVKDVKMYKLWSVKEDNN